MIAALALSIAMTNFFDVRVVAATDGDTLKVELPNVPSVFSPIGVRIAGIDSAELHSKKPCERREAVRAKTALQSLVSSGRVDLLYCRSDKFYRLLCDAKVGKQDVAKYMLVNGYAISYFGEKKSGWVCK